jgi:hypothetical protein
MAAENFLLVANIFVVLLIIAAVIVIFYYRPGLIQCEKGESPSCPRYICSDGSKPTINHNR